VIINAFSNRVLDDPGFSTSNGTLIQQYQFNDGYNQWWGLTSLDINGQPAPGI
jgi:hypothetical protein